MTDDVDGDAVYLDGQTLLQLCQAWRAELPHAVLDEVNELSGLSVVAIPRPDDGRVETLEDLIAEILRASPPVLSLHKHLESLGACLFDAKRADKMELLLGIRLDASTAMSVVVASLGHPEWQAALLRNCCDVASMAKSMAPHASPLYALFSLGDSAAMREAYDVDVHNFIRPAYLEHSLS